MEYFTYNSDIKKFEPATIISASDVFPKGMITPFAGTTAPTGWLICDGSTFSATAYPQLAAVLGNTYGASSGNTYYLPDLRGRTLVGQDTSQTEFNLLGETGGSKTSVAPHDHSIEHNHDAFNATSGNQSADHSHPFDLNIVHSDGTPVTGEILNVGIYYGGGVSRYQDGTGGQYGGQVHTHTTSIDVPAFTGTSGTASAAVTSGNLQPYLTVNYIIKY